MTDGREEEITKAEYASQMSLWCMLASPLAATNDIRHMTEEVKRILLNPEVILLNQDSLGKQAVRKLNNETWIVFLKPLANGDYALAILNRTDQTRKITYNFGLTGNYQIRDLWQHKVIATGNNWSGNVNSYETKLFRLIRK
ncbi:alpha-galactosidase [Pedobacter cryoconitis]|uniref:Alpha-galactosidase n=2 Tax=Pedobacter cryoconitis TaxID=188932 RepID=A0A327SL45_9SPHI|nr:alpha-galactosidase [Pedobacter cryoconitis]